LNHHSPSSKARETLSLFSILSLRRPLIFTPTSSPSARLFRAHRPSRPQLGCLAGPPVKSARQPRNKATKEDTESNSSKSHAREYSGQSRN
jgi:hypothetical protein